MKKHSWSEDLVTLVVQVNGKVRDRLECLQEPTKSETERLALAAPKVQVFHGRQTNPQSDCCPGTSGQYCLWITNQLPEQDRNYQRETFGVSIDLKFEMGKN